LQKCALNRYRFWSRRRRACSSPAAPRACRAPTIAVPTPVAQDPPRPLDSLPRGRAQVIVNGETGPAGPVVCDTANDLTTVSIGESSLGSPSS
jgi:hypothetical protein